MSKKTPICACFYTLPLLRNLTRVSVMGTVAGSYPEFFNSQKRDRVVDKMSLWTCNILEALTLVHFWDTEELSSASF